MPQSPSPVERLFRQYQTVAAQKARCYALFDTIYSKAGAGPAGDAAIDRAEALCDAAYKAVEAVVDAILAITAERHADLAIQAQVLAQVWSSVDGYRNADVASFLANVQAFADAR